ncbi:MAG: hypothetical protein WHT06_05215 [Desulfobacterales bacterium]
MSAETGTDAARSERGDDVLPDNGGRRRLLERRRFLYTCYIPERRSGADRRRGDDRRQNPRTESGAETFD